MLLRLKLMTDSPLGRQIATATTRRRWKEGRKEGRKVKDSYLAHVFFEAGLKHAHGRQTPTAHGHIRVLVRRSVGINLV